MAIENLKSDLYRDQQAGGNVPDALLVKGRTKTATGTITNGAADSNTSKYLLVELPSHVLIDPNTEFKVSGWGFADLRIGTKDDVTAFVNLLTAAAATQPMVTKFDANHGKALWEVAGLAEDPGGVIGIYAHAVAAAAGAGTMPFVITYIDN